MVEQKPDETNLQVVGFFINYNLSMVEQNPNETNLQKFGFFKNYNLLIVEQNLMNKLASIWVLQRLLLVHCRTET